jgi:hypothetical protein
LNPRRARRSLLGYPASAAETTPANQENAGAKVNATPTHSGFNLAVEFRRFPGGEACGPDRATPDRPPCRSLGISSVSLCYQKPIRRSLHRRDRRIVLAREVGLFRKGGPVALTTDIDKDTGKGLSKAATKVLSCVCVSGGEALTEPGASSRDCNPVLATFFPPRLRFFPARKSDGPSNLFDGPLLLGRRDASSTRRISRPGRECPILVSGHYPELVHVGFWSTVSIKLLSEGIVFVCEALAKSATSWP